MRYPPLRYYLERVLRDMGGLSPTGPLRGHLLHIFAGFPDCGNQSDWESQIFAESRREPQILQETAGTAGARRFLQKLVSHI